MRKLYRLYVLGKLAKYFDIPKTTLVKAIDLDTELIDGYQVRDVIPTYSPTYDIYATHTDNLSLHDLFDYNRFIDSDYYIEYLQGLGLAKNVSSYRFTLHVKGLIFIIYSATLYDGCGGVFIKNNAGQGFIIQPIDNWLKDTYPK